MLEEAAWSQFAELPAWQLDLLSLVASLGLRPVHLFGHHLEVAQVVG